MTYHEALKVLIEMEAGGKADRETLHQVRAVAREMADDAEKEHGTTARLALLRRLFQAGVFREPPLSGAPYDAWRELYAEAFSIELPANSHDSADSGNSTPLFSVLMPVYNPAPTHLVAAIESVLAQSWTSWELCIADDGSTDATVREILQSYAAQDARVKIVFRQQNGHISEASNTALGMATGPWCALLDHDDLLAPFALAVMAEAVDTHPEAAVFFSDEDQFDADAFINPMFKHGFDPDLLLTCNCVSHLGVYKTSLMRELGGFRRGLEGAQDHDLALRCLAHFSPTVMGNLTAFCHVPGVLYHWRRHAGSSSVDWTVKPYVQAAALKARLDYATTLGLQAEFSFLDSAIHTAVCFTPPRSLLSLCLLAVEAFLPAAVRDLVARTHWNKREILLVVRQSDKGQAERVAAEVRAHVLTISDDVDAWNAVNVAANVAAAAARGAALGFVRVSDIPLNPDWCERAMGALCRPGVAVVGCRAVDRNGFLIHAGYAVEQLGQNTWRVCPAYGGLHTQSGGYFRWAHLLHSVMAVPLSGMFCLHSTLEALGGLTTDFSPSDAPLASLDFCLRAAHLRHQRCVILPDADLLSLRSEAPMPVKAHYGEFQDFAACWHTILSAPPCQNPYLNWVPGAWTLLEPEKAAILR